MAKAHPTASKLQVAIRLTVFSGTDDAPADFLVRSILGRPVSVNHREFLGVVYYSAQLYPMRKFLLIEGSSCVRQPSCENLRCNAAENAL